MSNAQPANPGFTLGSPIALFIKAKGFLTLTNVPLASKQIAENKTARR